MMTEGRGSFKEGAPQGAPAPVRGPGGNNSLSTTPIPTPTGERASPTHPNPSFNLIGSLSRPVAFFNVESLSAPHPIKILAFGLLLIILSGSIYNSALQFPDFWSGKYLMGNPSTGDSIYPAALPRSAFLVFNYFYPSYISDFLSLSDIHLLGFMIYLAYPFITILLGVLLWCVLIGVLKIAAGSSNN